MSTGRPGGRRRLKKPNTSGRYGRSRATVSGAGALSKAGRIAPIESGRLAGRRSPNTALPSRMLQAGGRAKCDCFSSNHDACLMTQLLCLPATQPSGHRPTSHRLTGHRLTGHRLGSRRRAKHSAFPLLATLQCTKMTGFRQLRISMELKTNWRLVPPRPAPNGWVSQTMELLCRLCSLPGFLPSVSFLPP